VGARGRRALDAEREREGRPIAKDRSDRLFEACRRLEEELDAEHAAHAAYDAWRARGIAADGSRRMAPGMVKAHESVPVPTGLMNLTDHDSRPMRTHGFKPLQGYNAQLAVNEQQVIIAAELTCDSPDFGHLEPMVRAAQRELRGVEARRPRPGAGRRRLLASAPDRDGRQRRHPSARLTGLQPAPRRSTGLDRRPLRLHAARARHPGRPRALPPPPGHHRARLRPAQVQPPHHRFQRRGRAACRSEWRLIAATHNLLKLHRHRLSAATA
jgi:hypothetical protein